ncbi:MAG: 2'-5' RNA ligase family protein, partial [Bacteroidia bacterium]|nr:2'-5' RNA ligase family protein [Bacteroidia bacterium]
KYFIAIVLPEPIQGKIENIKHTLFQKHGLKGALRSPAHITLHRPFEWREEKEKNLIDALKGFNPGGAFDLRLHNFGFFEPRVIYADVVPNGSLNILYNNLLRFAKRELKLFNEAEDMRGFHPHVTIAFRDLKKPLFYELREQFVKETIDENFQCHTFSLLKLHEKWEVLHNFNI